SGRLHVLYSNPLGTATSCAPNSRVQEARALVDSPASITDFTIGMVDNTMTLPATTFPCNITPATPEPFIGEHVRGVVMPGNTVHAFHRDGNNWGGVVGLTWTHLTRTCALP
ncbi:MAG TPA: hypothetical protein VEI97_14130, partial [bacterium]|nr:hypothetical protein [bacterium]